MIEREERIKKLEQFKEALVGWSFSSHDPEKQSRLRTYINHNKIWVRQEVIEGGCFSTVTVGPPPVVGGLVMRNLDPFEMIFNPPYRRSLIPQIIDMIEQTVGVLLAPREIIHDGRKSEVEIDVQAFPNYAFIAMAMHAEDAELDDVLDAIKEGASRCGIQAERIDDLQSNERITDRVLESIRNAEYVVVDLTHSKPNVYYEAGYAQALGKTPIYLAKHGTTVEFDLKDYPVIFFSGLRQLKDSLEKRLRSLADRKN